LEKVGVGKGYVEENCGGGQGLNCAVESTGERERERVYRIIENK
jgi:hypothetical protein